MVGDAAHADVAAGRAAGTRTGWVSHGRAWADGPCPDAVGTTVHDVVAAARETVAAAS
jgi:FMN phosphatase YigB (HAD superfamily)